MRIYHHIKKQWIGLLAHDRLFQYELCRPELVLYALFGYGDRTRSLYLYPSFLLSAL
jgi:hypothetical protein